MSSKLKGHVASFAKSPPSYPTPSLAYVYRSLLHSSASYASIMNQCMRDNKLEVMLGSKRGSDVGVDIAITVIVR